MMHFGMGFGLVPIVAFWIGLMVLGIWLECGCCSRTSIAPGHPLAPKQARARSLTGALREARSIQRNTSRMKRAIAEETR